MEVNELVTALRVCADDDVICPACERYDKECDGSFNGPTFLMQEAATALESQQKRITELEAADRWIPVTERLPEDDLPKGSKVKQIKVLTALKSDKGVRTVRSQLRYRMTWYNSAPWAWKCSGSEITHWMPLPEPPNEEQR